MTQCTLDVIENTIQNAWGECALNGTSTLCNINCDPTHHPYNHDKFCTESH